MIVNTKSANFQEMLNTKIKEVVHNREKKDPSRETLLLSGKVSIRNNQEFDQVDFGKQNIKYDSYQGCYFKEVNFNKATFNEVDFRWSVFEDCKGFKFDPSGNMIADNFIKCDFRGCEFKNTANNNQEDS